MSNRQTKEETDRSLGIAPNSAAQDWAPDPPRDDLVAQARRQIADLRHFELPVAADIMEQLVDRIERDAQVRANYEELLYAVKSRHQTALMYIRAAEASCQSGDAAMGAADEGGGRDEHAK